MKKIILYIFPIIIIELLITMIMHLKSHDIFFLHFMNNTSIYEIMSSHLFYSLKYHFIIGCIAYWGLIVFDILMIIIQRKKYVLIYKYINYSITISIIELSLISLFYYIVGKPISAISYEYIYDLFTIIIFTYCISLISLFIFDFRINKIYNN